MSGRALDRLVDLIPWGVACAIVAFAYRWFGKALADAKSRRQLAAWMRSPYLDQWYEAVLRRGLDWCERFFGASRSYRAFDRCVLLALVYTFAVFMAGWAFGESGSIGALKVFGDAASPGNRWSAVVAITATTIFVFF